MATASTGTLLCTSAFNDTAYDLPPLRPGGADVGSSGWKPREAKPKRTIAPDGAGLSTRTDAPAGHGSRRPLRGDYCVGRSRSQGSRPELPTRTPPEPSIAAKYNEERRQSTTGGVRVFTFSVFVIGTTRRRTNNHQRLLRHQSERESFAPSNSSSKSRLEPNDWTTPHLHNWLHLGFHQYDLEYPSMQPELPFAAPNRNSVTWKNGHLSCTPLE